MKIKKVYRHDLKAYRWKIDITINGKRIRRAEFLTKQEAIEAIASRHTKARAERYGLALPKPKITLQNLYDKLSKDKALRSRAPLIATFKEFLESVDPDLPLNKLTRADWKKFLTQVQTRDLKPGTINQYLSRVSGALNRAGDYFPELVEWRAPRAPWLSAPPGRERLLSIDEVSKILAALRSPRQKHEHAESVSHRIEAYDLFRLMLLTGAREGEILNLAHRQISWDWRTVQIDATKTNTKRVIPLSSSALEILSARKANGPKLFKRLTYHALYAVLRRASELAEIDYGDRVEGGWVLYDLRHLAGTIMESAGVPYSAVSAILGHKRKDQTATYTHVQMETMRRGVETLEKHCREIDGFFPGNAENHLDMLMSRKSFAK